MFAILKNVGLTAEQAKGTIFNLFSRLHNTQVRDQSGEKAHHENVKRGEKDVLIEKARKNPKINAQIRDTRAKNGAPKEWDHLEVVIPATEAKLLSDKDLAARQETIARRINEPGKPVLEAAEVSSGRRMVVSGIEKRLDGDVGIHALMHRHIVSDTEISSSIESNAQRPGSALRKDISQALSDAGLPEVEEIVLHNRFPEAFHEPLPTRAELAELYGAEQAAAFGVMTDRQREVIDTEIKRQRLDGHYYQSIGRPEDIQEAANKFARADTLEKQLSEAKPQTTVTAIEIIGEREMYMYDHDTGPDAPTFWRDFKRKESVLPSGMLEGRALAEDLSNKASSAGLRVNSLALYDNNGKCVGTGRMKGGEVVWDQVTNADKDLVSARIKELEREAAIERGWDNHDTARSLQRRAEDLEKDLTVSEHARNVKGFQDVLAAQAQDQQSSQTRAEAAAAVTQALIHQVQFIGEREGESATHTIALDEPRAIDQVVGDLSDMAMYVQDGALDRITDVDLIDAQGRRFDPDGQLREPITEAAMEQPQVEQTAQPEVKAPNTHEQQSLDVLQQLGLLKQEQQEIKQELHEVKEENKGLRAENQHLKVQNQELRAENTELHQQIQNTQEFAQQAYHQAQAAHAENKDLKQQSTAEHQYSQASYHRSENLAQDNKGLRQEVAEKDRDLHQTTARVVELRQETNELKQENLIQHDHSAHLNEIHRADRDARSDLRESFDKDFEKLSEMDPGDRAEYFAQKRQEISDKYDAKVEASNKYYDEMEVPRHMTHGDIHNIKSDAQKEIRADEEALMKDLEKEEGRWNKMQQREQQQATQRDSGDRGEIQHTQKSERRTPQQESTRDEFPTPPASQQKQQREQVQGR